MKIPCFNTMIKRFKKIIILKKFKFILFRRKMKKRIGFVTNYIFSEYSDSVSSGVRKYCIENDIELVLFSIGFLKSDFKDLSSTHYKSMIPFINSNNLDGIIISSGSLLHDIDKTRFIEFSKNFDNLDVVSSSVVLDGVPSVVVDIEKEYDSLIQYLIDFQNCKKFAFVGVKSFSDEVIQRTEIFKRVCNRNKIPLDNIVFFESNFEYAKTYRILYDYNEKNGFDFDAVICLNDDMAFACLEFCKFFLKKRIPEDIIITGFDNIPRGSFSSPTLTSVDQQIAEIGYESAKVLCEKLNGKKVENINKVSAKTILRQSSERNNCAENACAENSSLQNEIHSDVNNNSVLLWYTRRSQILQAATFYTSENIRKNLDDVGRMLTLSLQSFGLQGAAVVLFEKPVVFEDLTTQFILPHNATLISGFDYVKNFNTLNCKNKIVFDPTKMILPEECFNYEPQGTVIFPIFFDVLHYGYVLLKYGDYDTGVYELLQRSISYHIKIAFDYESMQNEQEEILHQNEFLDMLSQTDEMTGLKNRRGFFYFAQSILTLAEKKHQSGYIFFCDMDGLKKINDNFGHENGDKAIITQGKVLSEVFSANDILARLGGDEFAIISPKLEDKKISEIKEKIQQKTKEFKISENLEFDFSLSVGFVKYPLNNSYKIDELLSAADKVLYDEKKLKKAKKVDEKNHYESKFRV